MQLPASVLPLAADPVLERGPDGRHRARYWLPVPYFKPLFAPLVARRARQVERAADAGRPLPDAPVWWAPPEPQPPAVTAGLAAACAIALVLSYGGSLLTQTLPYAADVYDRGDAALGAGLAAVRIGVLVALALGPLADRRGRRDFVLAAAVAHCAVASVIGLAPTFEVYVGGHVVLRAIDTSINVALAVLVAEIVPARNRALTLAVLFLAAGSGVALAIVSLPLAAAGRGGFAAVYALQLLALPVVLHTRRWLAESARYVTHARERHGLRELLGGPHRPRLALVGATAFLSAIFLAPLSQFFNRFLDDVHDFTSEEIVVFLAVTGLPSVPFLILGGRLADRVGRKRVGVPLTLGATLAFAGVFLSPTPGLWGLTVVGNVLFAAGGAALAVYGPELFPTRVRAAANTALSAMAVTGSALGLLAAGVLGDAVGLGPAIAMLAVFPLLSLAVVALRFPETAGRELEDTSGERA